MSGITEIIAASPVVCVGDCREGPREFACHRAAENRCCDPDKVFADVPHASHGGRSALVDGGNAWQRCVEKRLVPAHSVKPGKAAESETLNG